MKLRNKKTGEIALFVNAVDIHDRLVVSTQNGFKYYNSLAEINEEWEDYKEPKEYWYIDADGELFCGPSDDRCEFDNKCKQIGNYFETEEEAQQAVEKLKAWKRLKDKGFVFNGVNEDDGSIKTGLSKGVEICKSVEFYEDMTLLFGGEE